LFLIGVLVELICHFNFVAGQFLLEKSLFFGQNSLREQYFQRWVISSCTLTTKEDPWDKLLREQSSLALMVGTPKASCALIGVVGSSKKTRGFPGNRALNFLASGCTKEAG
jgi:hypothetical protein